MTSPAFNVKPASFDDFVKLANFFYITIGIEPYRRAESHRTKTLLNSVVFYVGIINMNYVLISEIGFVLMASVKRENFLEATMTMSYIGFVMVGNFKMIFIYRQKQALTKFIEGLQQIFPKSVPLQREYELRHYLKQCSRITMSFSILYMILIWTYNLFAIVQYCVYGLWLNVHEVQQTLPYYMVTPWNWHNHWSYYLLYVSQDFAGYTSAAGQISSDLLLTACATQMVMHYDFISRKLATYKVKGKSKAGVLQDLEFLRYITKYHNNILDLSAQLNNVFGVPLFLNFATSSFIICFVGFQVTLGASPETIVKLLLFLFSSISQVYMICYYGQQLKDASQEVAQAVFKHDWYMADVRYAKMLVLIAARAQNPAMLQATSFVLISRETMTEIMQLSYKFFALLRTMYGE